MPATIELEEVVAALKEKEVQNNLEAFAVGLFYKTQKTMIKQFIQRIDKEKKALEKNDPDYEKKLAEINSRVSDFDKAFYITIKLISQLGWPENVRMIQALLSLDCKGTYLLNKAPIILDGNPFNLLGTLQQLGINSTLYCENARHNCSHTNALEQTDIPPQESVLRRRRAISEPGPSPSQAYRAIYKIESKVIEFEGIEAYLRSLTFDFDLLTQPSNETNINQFVSLICSLLEHARAEDALSFVNFHKPFPNKQEKETVVSLLAEGITYWIMTSLVMTPTIEVFDMRLKFIMSVFDRVMSTSSQHKLDNIPGHIAGDLYMVFAILAFNFRNSDLLKHHPLAIEHKDKFQKLFDVGENILPLYGFLSEIYNKTYGKDLSSMRLRLYYQMGAIETKTFVQETVWRGKEIFRYFNPENKTHSLTLKKLAPKEWALFQQIVNLARYCNSFVDKPDLPNCSFVYLHPKLTPDEKLLRLGYAAQLTPPRIAYKHFTHFHHAFGKEALIYISSQLHKLQISGKENVVKAATNMLINSIVSVVDQKWFDSEMVIKRTLSQSNLSLSGTTTMDRKLPKLSRQGLFEEHQQVTEEGTATFEFRKQQTDKEALEQKQHEEGRRRIQAEKEALEQKQREEEHRRIQAEKEALEQKQREEERRRIQVEKEALEQKQRDEERRRIQVEKEALEQKQREEEHRRIQAEQEMLDKQHNEEVLRRIQAEKEALERQQREEEHRRIQLEKEAEKQQHHREISPEDTYIHALTQLEDPSFKHRVDQPFRPYLNQLIQLIKDAKRANILPLEDLTNVLEHTYHLVDPDNKTSERMENYKRLANQMEGHPISQAKVIVGMMLVLLSVAATIALALTGVGTFATAAMGTATVLESIGLFAATQPRGVCKTMLNVVEEDQHRRFNH